MTHLFAWALVEESNGKFCERGSTWIRPWRQVWPFPVCEVGKYLTIICEQQKTHRSIYFILASLGKTSKSKVIDLIRQPIQMITKITSLTKLKSMHVSQDF